MKKILICTGGAVGIGSSAPNYAEVYGGPGGSGIVIIKIAA